MAQNAPGLTTGTQWAYGSWRRRVWCVAKCPLFRSDLLQPGAGTGPGPGPGLAVGIGLVFDAITDPLIGYLSDGTRSRWGRRHPWLFASIRFPVGRFVLFSLASAGVYRRQYTAVQLVGNLQCFDAHRAHHVRGAGLCHRGRTHPGLRRAHPIVDGISRRLLDLQQWHVIVDVRRLAGNLLKSTPMVL